MFFSLHRTWRWLVPVVLVLLFFVAVIFYFIFSATPAAAGLSSVWAVDDGTKVKADTLNHSLESSNGIFDGNKIEIFGARNETVAFQLILEGGSSATSNVSVELDQVGSITNGSVSNDPDTYFMNRNIELFQELYHDIDERSHGLVWETDGPEIPAGWSGPVPDALVPLNIDNNFSVSASRNQGVWVDVYIPKGTGTGVHNGTVNVKVNGQTCSSAYCQIPVELTVIGATLPDEPAVDTMLYFSCDDPDACLGRYYNPDSVTSDQTKKLQERHYKMLRRHQITGIIGSDSTPNNFLKERVQGTTFSTSNGYYGWGEGEGQNVYSISTYGGTLNSSQATTWTNWFSSNAPNTEYFLYTWDEPDSEDYDQINTIAANADPVWSFVTTGYNTSLNEVDIFCNLAEYLSTDELSQGEAAGKKVWAYNGIRPFSGTFAVDDVAVSPRVNALIQYKHSIPRWFYWESTYYNDFQGGGGQVNVFEDPVFSNGVDMVHGDGVLMYPGHDRYFASQDRDFMGPLPSIRLKNWRRGIQDAAYLSLVPSSQSSQRTAMLNTLVPRVLAQKEYGQAVSWSENGETWLSERRKIADIISDGSEDDGDGYGTVSENLSLVTAAGRGGGPHIRAFDLTGTARTNPNKLFPYPEAFSGGINVATGDIDGDGQDEIITAPKAGGGPQVRVFEADGTPRGIEIWPFHADSRTGINVATGDTDGDGKDEIAVSQEQNGQAWVKVYRYNNDKTVLGEWNAFGDAQSGASVAMGDIDNDNQAEVIVGAGPGGGPQIRVYEADGTLKPIQFFAFHPDYRGGIDVAAGDINNDGKDEIGVCQETGQAWCKVYRYNNSQTLYSEWKAYADFAVGANLDMYDIDGDSNAEVITGANFSGAPQARAFEYDGTAFTTTNFYAYDSGFRGGVDVAVGYWE
ncbi:MAG: VCBS repeat-containing protein [Parcubacteria group bacterium]|nr:VCBS repeat-containing protein [Parcubacteria group bacterium]